MPTAKARYLGGSPRKLIGDFSDLLKRKLRQYCPAQQADTDEFWGHPADEFVGHILLEARWAKEELHWHALESTKAELRAERVNLLKSLVGACQRLRTLSPDFARLLVIDADPLGCADRLDELIRHIEDTKSDIDFLPRSERKAEKNHAVAVEMAIRVLRVLQGYGIKPAATGDTTFGYTSDAVRILKLLGDDMKLVLSESTWRDIIIEAKAAAPDLR